MVKKELNQYPAPVDHLGLNTWVTRDSRMTVPSESCADWTHWLDRRVAWSEMCLAIAEACTSIKLDASWLSGVRGAHLIDVLLAAANRGVRVQVLAAEGEAQRLASLRSSGLVIRYSFRVVRGSAGPMVVDDRGAYLTWHDGAIDVDYPYLARIFGAAATTMGGLFNDVWEQAGGHPVSSPGSSLAPGMNAVSIRIGEAGATPAYVDLLALVAQSRHRLDISLDHWADAGLANALLDAANRGVVVRCVVWSGAEARLGAGDRLTLERLRRAGVAIRTHQADTATHNRLPRLIVVDKQRALWGFRPLIAEALALPGVGWLLISEGQAPQVWQGLFTRLWRIGAWLEPLSLWACWNAESRSRAQQTLAVLQGWLKRHQEVSRMWHLMRVAPGRWRVFTL
jgi:hypothetical protein